MGQGRAVVKNNWGVKLASVYLRHQPDNKPASPPEEMTWYNVDVGATTGDDQALVFTYGSPKDYWWIKFVDIGGRAYTCKDNFYCSIEDKDKGQVTFVLNGDASKMFVDFPSSSDCTVSIFSA